MNGSTQKTINQLKRIPKPLELNFTRTPGSHRAGRTLRIKIRWWTSLWITGMMQKNIHNRSFRLIKGFIIWFVKYSTPLKKSLLTDCERNDFKWIHFSQFFPLLSLSWKQIYSTCYFPRHSTYCTICRKYYILEFGLRRVTMLLSDQLVFSQTRFRTCSGSSSQGRNSPRSSQRSLKWIQTLTRNSF